MKRLFLYGLTFVGVVYFARWVVRLFGLVVLALVLSALSYGAIGTSMVWEVRSGASTNSGGGFDSTVAAPGTDYSQQASAEFNYTDLVIGGTTTLVTSVARPFSTLEPGNVIKITAGTGCTTGRYYVVSVSVITATLDRSAGTGASTCTAYLGGSMPYTDIVSGPVAGNVVWVKADGNHNQSADTVFNVGSSARYTTLAGYTTTRGDNGQATLRVTAGSVRPLRVDGGYNIVKNFIADCNGQTNCNSARFAGQNTMIQNLKSLSPTTSAGVEFANNNIICVSCAVTGAGSAIPGFSMLGTGDFCFYCVAVSGAGHGFTIADRDGCFFCVAGNNSGASSDGFSLGSATVFLSSCVAYGNGRDGVRYAAGSAAPNAMVSNCVLVSNTGYGINDSTGSSNSAQQQMLLYNAFFSNTAGARNQVFAGDGDVTLTAAPFTNGAGNDFSLNSTAGGGAALKSVGFPGALVLGGTGYLDIGALQVAAAAATVTVGYPVQ